MSKIPTVRRMVALVCARIDLRTDKDTHFTGSCAKDAVLEEDITGLKSNQITITRIAMLADQNLNFDVMFYGKDTFANADLDVDTFQSFQTVDLETSGKQIGGTGKYFLDVNDLALDYIDEDKSRELHVALCNRSATAKNEGATGEVVIMFTYIPRVF